MLCTVCNGSRCISDVCKFILDVQSCKADLDRERVATVTFQLLFKVSKSHKSVKYDEAQSLQRRSGKHFKILRVISDYVRTGVI